MKTIINILFLLIGTVSYAEPVKYNVTFKSLWNSADHVSFPRNAHFSPIVAVSHDSDYSLFSIGELSSPGLEPLAETGSTTKIHKEIDKAVDLGSVHNVVETGSLFPRRGADEISFEIEVLKGSPMLSFVTMIAPSPDWIVGVDSLNLFVGGGFVDSVSLDLFAINAGTEEGDFAGNYSINNRATNPQELLSYLTNIEGLSEAFATVRISKVK